MKSLQKIALLIGFFLLNQTLFAADKVLAIKIPEIGSAIRANSMIKKELPKSLDFITPKIVGGVVASRNEYPEFAQLFVDGLDGFVYSVCGATLISNNKILTAAHCTAGLGPSRFYVLPNFYSFNDNVTFNNLIPISAKREHPNYQQSTRFNNDVAVLTMSRTSNTPTAKIFAGQDQLVGYSATIIGTGVTTEGSTNPPATLRKVTIPIVSNAVCRNSYGVSAITDSMLCAGLVSGGRDSCQGDSGGPLWVTFEGQRTQAGIVSWGNGCARPNFYGVNARTSALIDFILQHAPGAKIVRERSGSIVPILQLLLLDDDQANVETSMANCDGGELAFNNAEIVTTSLQCRDSSFNQEYYKSYTFSLTEGKRISIKTLASVSSANTINLYSGSGESINLLESATWSTADGGSTFLIRDLVAGEYTIYIRTESPSTDINLSLTQYDCQISQIALDTPATFVFEHNCKDTEVSNEYVKYHSFSWPTEQSVYITATAASNSPKLVTLYRQDESQLTFVSSSGYRGANVVADIYRNDLVAGDYVLKTVHVEENASVTLEVNAEDCRTNDSISLGEQKIISYSEDCPTLRNQYQTVLDFNFPELKTVIITSNKLFHVNGTIAKLQYESEFQQNSEYVHTFGYFGDNTIVTTSNDTNDQIVSMTEKSCAPQAISIGDEVSVSFSPLCRELWTSRYEDYRTFTLNSNQNVTITALSNQTGPGVSLYQGDDLNNLVLLANGSGDYDVPAEIEQNLSPGTYTIRSHAEYSVYDFNLSIE